MNYNGKKLHKMVESYRPYQMAMMIQELDKENQRLKEVIEEAETEIDGLVDLMENDSENDYANLVAEVGFKLQKALEDK